MNDRPARSQLDHLPKDALRLLGGNPVDPDGGGTAIQLVTTDTDGHARCALLSAGECSAAEDGRSLRVAVWSESTTAENLRARRQGLVMVVAAATFVSASVEARDLGTFEVDHLRLRTFRLDVRDVRVDRVPYADLTSGITFQLGVPAADVLDRWRDIQSRLEELDLEASDGE